MGLLGDFLPKEVSGLKNTITHAGKDVSAFISGGTTNFDLASMSQKVGEGAKKMMDNFGSILNFKNVINGLPSGAVAAQLANQGISIGPGQTLSDYAETAAPRTNIDDVVVLLESTVSSDFVRFTVSPRVSESRQATYQETNLTHHPGAILKYDRTSARSWTISVRLVSRNQQEASINQADLNIIRSWVMPYYGSGTEMDSSSKLGAPPDVLKFSGYGPRNISPIPVVLESYSADWPNDIDYIPTMTGDPFPVIMELTLTLKESYSPAEYSKFNLSGYKTGMMPFAFNGISSSDVPSGKTANESVKTDEPAILGDTKAITGVPTAQASSGAYDPEAEMAKIKADHATKIKQIEKHNAFEIQKQNAEFDTIQANLHLY